MREIRYLDKLIDELAKGKAMEKICVRRNREFRSGTPLATLGRDSFRGDGSRAQDRYVRAWKIHSTISSLRPRPESQVVVPKGRRQAA
jgi:hypothetical protein